MIWDARSMIGDAPSLIGDAPSMIGDARSMIEEARRMNADCRIMKGRWVQTAKGVGTTEDSNGLACLDARGRRKCRRAWARARARTSA
eukprot:3283446-Pleurochrysis_carterae.AAC.1